MAKLAVKDRKKAKEAEAVTGSYEPLAPGKYLGDLMEVEERTSQKGNKFWNITYNNLHTMDGEKVPGRQWYMLMLPQDEMPADYKPSDRALQNADGDVEKAWKAYQEMVAGRIRAWFEAHGYDLSSDTDEMIGETAVLRIGIETIQQGPKTGEKTNRINAVLRYDGEGVDNDEDGDEF